MIPPRKNTGEINDEKNSFPAKSKINKIREIKQAEIPAAVSNFALFRFIRQNSIK
jgi:hypothetical protein